MNHLSGHDNLIVSAPAQLRHCSHPEREKTTILMLPLARCCLCIRGRSSNKRAFDERRSDRSQERLDWSAKKIKYRVERSAFFIAPPHTHGRRAHRYSGMSMSDDVICSAALMTAVLSFICRPVTVTSGRVNVRYREQQLFVTVDTFKISRRSCFIWSNFIMVSRQKLRWQNILLYMYVKTDTSKYTLHKTYIRRNLHATKATFVRGVTLWL